MNIINYVNITAQKEADSTYKRTNSTYTNIIAGVDISDICRSVAPHFSLQIPTDPSEARRCQCRHNSYGSNETPSLKKPRTTAPVEIQEAQQLKKSGRRSNGLGDGSISNTIITPDKEEVS